MSAFILALKLHAVYTGKPCEHGWHDSAKISRAADEIKKLMSCTLTSSIDILANTSEIQQPSHEYNTALQSSGCTSIAKLVAGCMQQQCASAVHLLFLLSMMNSTARHAYRHCVHATAMLQGCSACITQASHNALYSNTCPSHLLRSFELSADPLPFFLGLAWVLPASTASLEPAHIKKA